LEFRKLLGRFIDVCQAIEYAHSRGVLHRDLKPGNIMLGKYGETLVVDWGLAKAQGHDESASGQDATILRPASGSGSAPTIMGSAIGTPAFMPPEQAAGKLDELGPASDVYSLGATLYYLLTGKAPFAGNDLQEVLESVQKGNFPVPNAVCANVPKPLEAICLRAMSVRPDDRFESPQCVADEVERYLADEPVHSHAEPVLVRARRWMRKHPRASASLAATLFIGGLSAALVSTVVGLKNQELGIANQRLQKANLAERRARQEAEANLAFARNGNEILGSVFLDLDPHAEYATVSELRTALAGNLGKAAELLERSAVGQPLEVAMMQNLLGSSMFSLGESEKAVDLSSRKHRRRDSRCSARIIRIRSSVCTTSRWLTGKPGITTKPCRFSNR
jgi:hypothetical protein